MIRTNNEDKLKLPLYGQIGRMKVEIDWMKNYATYHLKGGVRYKPK